MVAYSPGRCGCEEGVVLPHVFTHSTDTVPPPHPLPVPDLQSLLSSLPLQSNTPPFLHTLISSLQHLSTPSHPTPAQHPTQDQARPPDITQMMAAFRQLRPTPNENKTSENGAPNGVGQGEGEPEQHGVDPDVEEKEEAAAQSVRNLEALLDRKMAELEQRLKCYIDNKVAAVLNEIEARLEGRVRDSVTLASNEDTHNSTQSTLRAQLEEVLD